MKGSWLQTLGSLGVVLAAVATAPTAQAFCRSMSCELGEEARLAKSGTACARDASGCVTEGEPLHWGSPCINYAVQRDGSPKLGLDGASFAAAIEQAFATWQSAKCPGGGSPRFQAQSQGFVSCAQAEAVWGGAAVNANVLMFHDQGWPADANGAIGLTTPSGGINSGLIIDADLELNSQDFSFRVGASELGQYQLDDVLAHEVGHFLGLGHSDVTGALMSRYYQNVGLSQELLTPDDIAAICAAYPPGASLACPVPGAPAYDECQTLPGEPKQACDLSSMTHDRTSQGCSFAPTTPERSFGVPMLLAGLLWLGRRRTTSRGLV